jgi:hypothetical protein
VPKATWSHESELDKKLATLSCDGERYSFLRLRSPPMALEQAKQIIASGESITYPSRPAAQHVRSVMRGLIGLLDWHLSDTAPTDGTHILVCTGPYSKHWGFNQSPPLVVHYFADQDNPGFYPSHGIVQGSYNDAAVSFTHWRHLGEPPKDSPHGR